LRIWKEVRDLPVEKYDLVINDFESITSLACAYKKVPSVNFRTQGKLYFPKVPRPEKRDVMGEWILRNYARATQYVGLHFKQYDELYPSAGDKKRHPCRRNPRIKDILPSIFPPTATPR